MYQYRIPSDDIGSQSAEEEGRGCHIGCDGRSAGALERILSQVDELNNRDFQILGEIVGRFLCSRS